MLFSSILISVILIACGFLVKENPNLIAGYNTLNKKNKKRIDIENLSKMMKTTFIIMGVLIVFSGLILYFLEIKESYSLLINCSIVILGIIIMIINAKKFNKNS
ncbi:DUF3784 domain-containing protein [Pontimicrobium sp. SW4]|uniref:DUF3784 domain-containing protein n=1 Tax=Pontimicrobium sp. SW4 TaxID=3153519 RepID=A0AAU7BWZ3_9FLAO